MSQTYFLLYIHLLIIKYLASDRFCLQTLPAGHGRVRKGKTGADICEKRLQNNHIRLFPSIFAHTKIRQTIGLFASVPAGLRFPTSCSPGE